MKPENKPSRLWRRVERGTLTIEVPGLGTVVAREGTWLESQVIRHILRGVERAQFGPTLPDAHLERRIGYRPPLGQVVVDPDAVGGVGVVVPPVQMPSPPAGPRSAELPPDVYHLGAEAPPASARFITVASEDAEFPRAAVAECVRLLEREPDLDVAVPLHNIGSPICAPQGREAGASGALRLPAGRSPRTIAEALLALPLAHTSITPNTLGAAVVRASALDAWRAGTVPRSKAATCLTAFAWLRPGGTTVPGLVEQSAGPQPTASLIQPVREAVAKTCNPGPRFLFVAGGVGPVGGSQVVLNLVDALNDLGYSAAFAHLHTGSYAHKFRSRSAPLALTPAELARDIEERVGWPRGEPAMVVATSFASGKIAASICERRPHFRPVAWWQDREDLFERPDNRAPHPSEFTDYLAIPRAVSVSRWVRDTAGPDLGVHPEWHVINPTVDPDFLASRRGPRADGPVRILSMWRPMTPVRRGLPLLREVYAALARKYKRRISLELFGWPEDAPAGVRHHGHLSTREVGALMREVDIVVEPSAYQGYGLSGLEAIASGACLVSTACRGVDEYAVHEQNALVVPHDELLGAVCRAIDDEALRARLAAAGSVEPWSVVAQRWADVLMGWMP